MSDKVLTIKVVGDASGGDGGGGGTSSGGGRSGGGGGSGGRGGGGRSGGGKSGGGDGDPPLNNQMIQSFLSQMFPGMGRMLMGGANMLGINPAQSLGGLMGGGGGAAGGVGGAGAAGGAAGGMGGMMAAAGPFAIAGAAVMAVNEFGNALRSFTKDFGTTTASLVRGDFGPAIHMAAEKMTDFIAVISPAAGVVAKFVLGLFEATTALKNAFLSEANRLAGLSPEISVAKAEAEIRSLLLDLKEAEKLGGGLANIVEMESEITEALREAFMPIKEDLLKFTQEMMVILRDGAQWLADNKDVLKAMWDISADVLKSLLPLAGIAEMVRKAWPEIAESLDIHKRKNDIEKIPLGMFEQALDRSLDRLREDAMGGAPAELPRPVLN